MRYADLSFKKIVGILLIAGILITLVATTAVTWERTVGTFSIPSVGFTLTSALSTWQYRMEFNWQFGIKPAPGAASLLALIGFSPPVASSQALAPTATTAQSIPVLLYHGILPASTGADVTSIDTFKQQMFALKSAGWQTVSIEDFVAAMKGEKTLPPKSFCSPSTTAARMRTTMRRRF
jgi:hypothetical protein